MKKIYIAILIAAFIMSGILVSGELTPIMTKKCCIAGVYEGWNKDIASKTCPEPGKGKFTMYLYQEKGCGSKIWGKVVDPTNPGDPMVLKGTVTSTIGSCCIIKGTVSKTGESNTFVGKICKVLGKWTVKKGTFKGSRGCNGTFGMTWVRAHRLLTPRVIKKKD
ncbi:MAG: hypothetical protein KAS97_06150 [Candidatus Aminicenantes bacterium]|nr:hypothetical protein [Candidatus Aminicenantes bacterium]